MWNHKIYSVVNEYVTVFLIILYVMFTFTRPTVYVPNHFPFPWFAAYFSTIRSEQLESVIARVDLDVVKIIIEKVSGEDNAAFRNLFSLWLQNLKSEHQYHLNTKDEKTELKAIMLLASIMLINVNESDNQEQKNNDLQKFFNEIIDHSFFSGSMQCLAVLLFGIVDSSVSTSNPCSSYFLPQFISLRAIFCYFRWFMILKSARSP